MGVGMCLYAQLVQTKNKQCKSAIVIHRRKIPPNTGGHGPFLFPFPPLPPLLSSPLPFPPLPCLLLPSHPFLSSALPLEVEPPNPAGVWGAL